MEAGTDHVKSPETGTANTAPSETEDKNGSHTPNESEAETDILPGSQRPTPRKKPRVKEEVEGNSLEEKDHNHDGENTGGEESVVTSAVRAAASRKRKAEEPGVQQEHKDANGYHSDPKLNSSKKARLSSPEERDQQSDDGSSSEESESDEESGSGEEVIRAGRRRGVRKTSPPSRLRNHGSGGESRRRAYNFRHPNDSSTLRISTSAQPTTSPSSPTQNHPASAALHPRSPYLRSSHRRSSSFHTTALDLMPDEMALGYGARRFGSSVPAGENESSGRSVSQPAPGRKLVDRIGRTPLARACSKGDPAKVEALLKSPPPGLDFNRADNDGNTALQIAALEGSEDIVKLLLEYGCEVNTINGSGDTPLQDAMDNDHDEVVALLKAAGAREKQELQTNNSQARQRPNYSYLYTDHTVPNLIRSIKERDAKTIDYLLRSVQPNIECLIAAIESHIPDLPSLLLAQKADDTPPLHKMAHGQKTPIVAAIECGNNEAIELLLANGADPRDVVPGTSLSHDKYCLERRASGYKQAYRMLFKARKSKSEDTDKKDSASDEEVILSDDEPPKDETMASPSPVKTSPNSDTHPASSDSPPQSKTKSSPSAPGKVVAPKSPAPKPKSPTPLPTPTPPREPIPPPLKPTEAELEAARVAARAEYLSALPAGLAALLSAPSKEPPVSPSYQSNSATRTFSDFLPLYGMSLATLGPHRKKFPVQNPDQSIYIPSLYVVLALGVESLEEVHGKLGSVLKMTLEEKEMFWRRRRLWEVLGTETKGKQLGSSGKATAAVPTVTVATELQGQSPSVDPPAEAPQTEPPPAGSTKQSGESFHVQTPTQHSNIKEEREKFLELELEWYPLAILRDLAAGRWHFALGKQKVREQVAGLLRCDIWVGGRRVGFA